MLKTSLKKKKRTNKNPFRQERNTDPKNRESDFLRSWRGVVLWTRLHRRYLCRRKTWTRTLWTSKTLLQKYSFLEATTNKENLRKTASHSFVFQIKFSTPLWLVWGVLNLPNQYLSGTSVYWIAIKTLQMLLNALNLFFPSSFPRGIIHRKEVSQRQNFLSFDISFTFTHHCRSVYILLSNSHLKSKFWPMVRYFKGSGRAERKSRQCREQTVPPTFEMFLLSSPEFMRTPAQRPRGLCTTKVVLREISCLWGLIYVLLTSWSRDTRVF